jgi:hypothetical protein
LKKISVNLDLFIAKNNIVYHNSYRFIITISLRFLVVKKSKPQRTQSFAKEFPLAAKCRDESRPTENKKGCLFETAFLLQFN